LNSNLAANALFELESVRKASATEREMGRTQKVYLFPSLFYFFVLLKIVDFKIGCLPNLERIFMVRNSKVFLPDQAFVKQNAALEANRKRNMLLRLILIRL
jgi:hypothetical protein